MKHYNMSQLLDKNADVNFSIGGRCSGKSYQMALFLVKHWLETGKEFVRAIRSWMYAKGLENYFDEVVYNEDLPVQVHFNHNKYYIQRLDDEGKLVGKEVPFGYCEVITTEQAKKSVQFPNVDIMFMEEFVAADAMDYALGSFEQEWFHLKSLISTVFRKREGKLFFIGNNMDVSNPYFEMFGIKGTDLKLGQIKTFTTEFEANGKKVKGQKVAVEVVPIGWDNIDEIPVLLRMPDNEIATTGELTVADDVLEGAVKFFHDGYDVCWFAIDGKLTLYKPLIATWSWYRGNPYGDLHCCGLTDDKFRRYLTIVDYNGNCLIAEIPEVEDCSYIGDFGDFAGVENRFELCNLADDCLFPVDACGKANVVNGDLETLWHTSIKAVYYNDMLTRYDYKTDRAEVVKQESAARKLGFGSGSKTETVKDYEAMMASGKAAGWRERSSLYNGMDFIDYKRKATSRLDETVRLIKQTF